MSGLRSVCAPRQLMLAVVGTAKRARPVLPAIRGRFVKRVRTRSTLRVGLAVGMATAVMGLTATSALALNHTTYNILRNAQQSQRCLDMDTRDPAEGARAQLFDCGGNDQRQFLLVTTSPGGGLIYDEIRPKGSRGSGRCLFSDGVAGATVIQRTCDDFNQAQSWSLRSTGEIVNIYSGYCLDATGDVNNAPVVTRPCNGTISQRWFF